jgi:iron-dependent repressor protein
MFCRTIFYKGVKMVRYGYHKAYVEQNYLEIIFILYQKQEIVRNIDIAGELNLARATVTQMLRNLEKKGYIEYKEDKIVRFTKEGEMIAEKLYKKHVYLTKVLKHMGIEDDIAEKEACQIEHAISDNSFKKIKKYFDKKL